MEFLESHLQSNGKDHRWERVVGVRLTQLDGQECRPMIAVAPSCGREERVGPKRKKNVGIEWGNEEA